jgi:hypothetical protein
LFEQLPSFEGMRPEEARRVLSTVYLDLIAKKSQLQRATGDDRAQVFDYVRRLANTLESFSVFDRRSDEQLRKGGAFVAAEALSLLVESANNDPNSNEIDLNNDTCYAAIEAALLFTIAGFDANAATVTKRFDTITSTTDPLGTVWAAQTILGLCTGAPKVRELSPPALPITPASHRASSAMWQQIGGAIQEYFRWLCLDSEEGLSSAKQRIQRVRSLQNGRYAPSHAKSFHLAQLIEECINATSGRALRSVGPISDAWYRNYVTNRSAGRDGLRARPFFWPSTGEYARSCLPGPINNAVVRVPTGAGKSFIAELASANAMLQGWVLYLVPTNALAAQVRNDLKKAFAGVGEVEIRAFLGGEEYTNLSEERVTTLAPRTIAVMTPEKCALALRLSASVFQSCRLCVFDECHLLSDGSRGVLAELVVSHLMTVAPECRFLLMSAMISNPDEIAKWLQDASGRPTVPINEDWRPTRSLRGVVGIDLEVARQNATVAFNFLKTLPPRRKKQKFTSPHVFVASLQGAWESSNGADYALLKLPTETGLEVNRQGQVDDLSWVNQSAATLTEHFAKTGSAVLTFLPASKHYPFSVGSRIQIGQTFQLDDQVNALLTVAEDELGVASQVGSLLASGVAVHTASLLEAEKSASESAFARRLVPAMLATGTLAQGLNLPASVVLVAGTTVGDRRNNSQADVARANAQILNALGRAGRAGVANHGLGLVIPDEPIYVKTPVDPSSYKAKAPVVAAEENSTQVTSSLERFLRLAVQGILNVRFATAEELVAMAYLSVGEGDSSTPNTILRKSYGMHRLYPATSENVSSAATDYLTKLRTSFVEAEHAPDWLPIVTYRTGLDYNTVLQLWRAMERAEQVVPKETIDGAIDACLSVITVLPPGLLTRVLETRFNTPELGILWSDQPPTTPNESWTAACDKIIAGIRQFVNGDTLAAIGQTLLGETIAESARTDGTKPIPRLISFTRTDISNVAQIAGAMAAIFEATGQLSPDTQTAPMIAPLAIKYGCRTVESLAWYRFAIRFRRVAHIFGRAYGVQSGGSDAENRAFVAEQFRSFLDGAAPPTAVSQSEMTLLNAVRTIVTSS